MLKTIKNIFFSELSLSCLQRSYGSYGWRGGCILKEIKFIKILIRQIILDNAPTPNWDNAVSTTTWYIQRQHYSHSKLFLRGTVTTLMFSFRTVLTLYVPWQSFSNSWCAYAVPLQHYSLLKLFPRSAVTLLFTVHSKLFLLYCDNTVKKILTRYSDSTVHTQSILTHVVLTGNFDNAVPIPCGTMATLFTLKTFTTRRSTVTTLFIRKQSFSYAG